MLAAAPGHGFGLCEIHFLGGKTRAFVGAVAERLAFGLATGAEVERAGFHRENERPFLGNGGIHGVVTVGLSGGKANGVALRGETLEGDFARIRNLAAHSCAFVSKQLAPPRQQNILAGYFFWQCGQ